MPLDAENKSTIMGDTETEAEVLPALSANAPFLPGDEDMHISPYPPKRPLHQDGPSSTALDWDEPTSKRPRRDGSVGRRSRSPRQRSPRRDRPFRERSRSRSRSRSSTSRSRHSRDRYHHYSRSPETNRSQRGSFIRERDRRQRDDRDATPPFERRRSSGGRGSGIREPEPRDVRRKADISLDERKRGQRLFGGLFSGLGQPAGRGGRGRSGPGPGSNVASIDRRHDRSLQTDEDRQKVAERLAKFERMRKIEQVKLDEKKMQILHDNKLVRAQSLCTTSKPMLYYRPRDLTEAQERTIEEQVRSAKLRIEQEKNDFEKEKQTRLAALGVQYTPKTATPEAADNAADEDRPQGPRNAENDKEDIDMAPPSPQQNADAMVDEPAGNTEAEEAPPGLNDHDDHDKGIIVETEEDTVIY